MRAALRTRIGLRRNIDVR